MIKSPLALTVLLAATATIPTFGANRPLINNATVDSTLQQVNINGLNLVGNKPTVVLFNGDTLQLESVSSTLVVAKLSPIPPAGTYLLALSTGNGSSDFDTFNVTIGVVGPQGPAGPGAISVLDANNNVLGTLIGLADTKSPFSPAPNGVVVYRNGYFINLEFGGNFPVAIYTNVSLWTSATCSGTGYLSLFADSSPNFPSKIGTKIVIYSGQTNSLYVPAGSGPSLASSLVPSGLQSLENGLFGDGSSNCQTQTPLPSNGWLLSPFNASTTLGWSVSGNPLGVAGPIKFQ